MNYTYAFDEKSFDEAIELFDSCVSFEATALIGPEVQCCAWGVILRNLSPREWNIPIHLLPPHVQRSFPCALYVAGWTRLRFQSVLGGSLIVKPYAPCFEYPAKSYTGQGDELAIAREWPATGLPEYEYSFTSVLNQPYGFADFTFLSRGKVEISIQPSDVVTYAEYRDNVTAYRFSPFRQSMADYSPKG